MASNVRWFACWSVFSPLFLEGSFFFFLRLTEPYGKTKENRKDWLCLGNGAASFEAFPSLLYSLHFSASLFSDNRQWKLAVPDLVSTVKVEIKQVYTREQEGNAGNKVKERETLSMNKKRERGRLQGQRVERFFFFFLSKTAIAAGRWL